MRTKIRQQIATSVSRAAHSVRFASLEKLESRQLLSAGDLDPTFGNAGWAVSGNLGTAETTVDAVVQSDGKVLEAISGPNNTFMVERLTSAGAVDTSYGTAGMTAINFGGDAINDAMGKLMVLNDGSAIVAGSSKTSFVLLHLTASGAIDSTFGSAGLATANVSSSNPVVNDLALQYNGKILVGGTGRGNLALVRFNTNGTLDKSFNGTGIVLQNLPGGNESIKALAIQPDGRIVAAGDSTDAGNHEHNTVMRFLSDGELDTTFNSIGYRSFGAADQLLSGVGVTADSQIIVSSTSAISIPSKVSVYRLNADGSTDTTFGTGGSTTFANQTTVSGNTSITAVNASASKLNIQNDGKVVIAGRIETAQGLQYAAAFRLNTNGMLDTTFGSGGIAVFQLYESNMPNSVAISADGKLVLSDSTVVAADDAAEPGVVCLTSTGALDTTFGIGGKATNDLTGKLAGIGNVITLPNGQILAAGWTESPRNGSNDFMVMRLNGDGSIDTTFGLNGVTTIDFDNYTDEADSIALQSDGKIVVAGRAHSDSGVTHTLLAVVRLNANGSLDTTFGVGGKATIVASDNGIAGMVVLSDDSIVASNDGHLVKFSKDGTIDPTYADTVIPGKYPAVRQMILTSDGKILLSTDDGMVCLNAADGSADSSFGINGVNASLSGPILAAANGEFLLASASGVSRYLANGTLDTSFGTAGTAAFPTVDGGVEPVAMQFTPDGKIAIASIGGNFSGSAGDQALSVLVLHADGSADISFEDGTISNPSSGFLNGSQTNYPAVMAVESDGSIFAAADIDGSPQGWDIAKFQGDFTISDPHVALSSNGTLTITGTNDGDSISVALSKDSSEVVVWVDGTETDLIPSSVNALSISALDGDDAIYASINVPTTIDGGAGNDGITTGNVSSLLHGGDGNDTITGGNAADSIYGDAGNDVLNGGDGTDYLSGGDGNDVLYGDGGNDTLDGGLGADQLWGGKGNDTADYHARGENLNISLDDLANDGASGEGDNVHTDIENVLGGMSSDVITGDKYANSIAGNGGADTIYGGSGNDTLNGGAGKDRLYGQNGDDTFIVKDGNRDTVNGGDGIDSASRDSSSTVADDVLSIERFI